MFAFGDAYVFVAVFGLLALVPTGAAELAVVAFAVLVWFVPLYW